MCIYKVWQHGFKTKQTLHINYDNSRSDECARCNFCSTACFLELDPRRTDLYDSCINCGECITACGNLQAKKGRPGLLSYEVGERHHQGKWSLFRTNMGSLSTRLKWTFPFVVLGLAMFSWGLISYQPYHLAAYRADTLQGNQIEDYRIRISSKLYQPSEFKIEIEGIDAKDFSLEKAKASLDSAGKIDINMQLNDSLSKGLHRIFIKVKSTDGWEDTYHVHHFVG
jgi:polyferredoxin